MGEMIERVAKAILAAHDWTQNPVSDEDGMQVPPKITGWEALTPDWQECLRDMARAAIEAMSEPTEEMETAGWDSLPMEQDDWSPVSAFERMIAAALARSTSKEEGNG